MPNKADNTVLKEYFSPDAIRLAYERVRRWTDRTIKDTVGIRAFGENADENITYLSNKVIKGEYTPSPAFKYFMPKASRTQRTRSILMIEDAIVYQAIADHIAMRSYDKLSELKDFVFGSVLNPEVKLGTKLFGFEKAGFFFFRHWKDLFARFRSTVITAIEEDEATYKFETDITGFFDSIPHYNLLLAIQNIAGVEDEILDLLSDCFNMWCGTKLGRTPGVGIPQGPPPSFFFANLLLHPLDELLIDKAYKYCRYMDDINIYGYDENDLFEAMVQIDNYLKTIGLSINSKKTSIEKIADGSKDSTVRELKKMAELEIYGASEVEELIERLGSQASDASLGPLGPRPSASYLSSLAFEPKPDRVEEALENFSIQDQSTKSGGSKPKALETISDPTQIRKFWESEIAGVKKHIPELFENSDDGLKLKGDTSHIDIIRYSARYGSALYALAEQQKDIKGSSTLLPYWLKATEKFIHRIDNLQYTLMWYKEDKILRKQLFDWLDQYHLYEWVRYYIYFLLGTTQSFTDRELRNLYKRLEKEESDFAKITLYKLLINHGKSDQLYITIKKSIAREESYYLRLILTDYIRLKKTGQDISELLEMYGI